MTASRHGAGRIGVLGLAVLLGAGAGPGLAQSSGPSQEVTHGLTDPKNGGVAGTGMGTTDPASRSPASGVGSGGATGTGMSVKGPPGQGISGPGTSHMDEDGTGGAAKPPAP